MLCKVQDEIRPLTPLFNKHAVLQVNDLLRVDELVKDLILVVHLFGNH